MKRINSIIITILLITAGCGRESKHSTDDLVIVDVTKNYPKKELILQDCMDVEYIALETNDDFVNQGVVMAIGKEIMLVKNRFNDGNIFVYDRNGKALRKLNRMGQGNEEYLYINEIFLDEDNNEIFVSSLGKKILVYNLSGTFKRSFRFTGDIAYFSICNYDKDNLICYDVSGIRGWDEGSRGSKSYHAIISKQDGSITREVYIPFKKNIPLRVDAGNGNVATFSNDNPIISNHDNWILSESSSDTVYNYLPDDHLIPLIVRTPSIQSMDPEVFLFPVILTDRYCFLRTVKKEFDFEKMNGFSNTYLVCDRYENAIFEYSMYNDDYSNKKQVTFSRPVNDEIVTWQLLEAHQLVEAYEKGELKGKLKEIAAELDTEDNPVIMIAKHKK